MNKMSHKRRNLRVATATIAVRAERLCGGFKIVPGLKSDSISIRRFQTVAFQQTAELFLAKNLGERYNSRFGVQKSDSHQI